MKKHFSAILGAWILWVEYSTGNILKSEKDKQWEINGGWEKFEDCSSAKNKELENHLEWETGFNNLEDKGNSSLNFSKDSFFAKRTFKDGTYYQYKWLCLPDAIDPRDKK